MIHLHVEGTGVLLAFADAVERSSDLMSSSYSGFTVSI
jgi:hypothetical protein